MTTTTYGADGRFYSVSEAGAAVAAPVSFATEENIFSSVDASQVDDAASSASKIDV